jgi:hypothetical protein
MDFHTRVGLFKGYKAQEGQKSSSLPVSEVNCYREDGRSWIRGGKFRNCFMTRGLMF